LYFVLKYSTYMDIARIVNYAHREHGRLCITQRHGEFYLVGESGTKSYCTASDPEDRGVWGKCGTETATEVYLSAVCD
jgi:hypothetical protein